MKRAVMATYRHVTSTDNNPDHSLCPTGRDSWCRHNSAVARGESAPKHSYNLPKDVARALLPVYERLSERKLLERCFRGKTQNSNESFHSVIWNLVPKERHSSLFAVEAAVAEAVLHFNTGSQHAAAKILGELNTHLPGTGHKKATEKDVRRSRMSRKKLEGANAMKKGVKRRHQDSMHPDYAPGAY